MNRILLNDLAPVQELYDQGLYLQAFQVAAQLGPLAEWRGGKARVLAGRLARQLGAPRMSHGHFLLARREDPDLPEVKEFYAMTIMERRGPYASWRLLKKLGDLDGAPPKIQSDWYALHAMIAAILRDFDTAETWLARSAAIMPENAWLAVTRAGVYHLADQYHETLDAARQALSLHPWYRPAVQATADAHVQLGQDEEALAILAEADKHIESAAVVWQQIGLLIELQLYQEAQSRFERLVELMPLMEKEGKQMMAGLLAEIAYFQNDFAAAIEHGQQSDHPFFKKIAEYLTDPERQRAPRVTLPVTFVRQHYQTCVPATLTTISRYWSRPAEHLEIANQICYNGTSAYNERQWAEQNDWLVREFTVSEESLIALIDRGVPFTLTTLRPGNAHMQAVMGYDGRRRTMLIRDPYSRHRVEYLIAQFLQEQAATGPRGMALVPMAERGKLENLKLPDEHLWDQLHQFDGALERNRWPEAEQIYQNMLSIAPGHRLTLEARRRLAIYDDNKVALLAAVELLLERYPDDDLLNITRLSCLSALGRRDELLAAYKALCAHKNSHPIFIQQYAQELAVEVSEQKRAIHLLQRAIRQWPMEAGGYLILANTLWRRREYEEALELYRFAICLGDKDENFARAYFSAALQLGHSEEALAFLKQRWQRFKSQSSLTARTLAWAYSQTERWSEAANVLEEALAQHPDDGELMLEATDLLAQESREYYARANELLAAARHKAPLRHWLRTAARLKAIRGRRSSSLALWQQLLDIQPLAVDAHYAIVNLLATTQNQEAALAHLQAYATRFPHFYPLQEMLVEWYRRLQRKEAYRDAAQKLVELAPQNDLGLGYLANALLLNDMPEEAYTALQTAFELNPAYSYAGYNLFDMQLQQDNLATAAGTLAVLEQHIGGPETTARSVLLALRLEDQERIKSGLETLCVTPDESGWALVTVIEAMDKAGMGEMIFETLSAAIKRPEAIPETGTYWMRACLLYSKPGCEEQLPELTAAGAIGERATEAYLFALLGDNQHILLRQYIERHRDWLSENATLCSQVAYILQHMGEKETALAWVQDWRQFNDPRPWMLITPVELYWESGRVDEVVEICRHALQLLPDGTTPKLRVWLAAAEVFSGEPESALENLGLVDPLRLDPQGHFLYQITDAVIRLALAPAAGRDPVFQTIRRQVQDAIQAIKKQPKFTDTYRLYYRQSLGYISRKSGAFRMRLWCYWMLLRDVMAVATDQARKHFGR